MSERSDTTSLLLNILETLQKDVDQLQEKSQKAELWERQFESLVEKVEKLEKEKMTTPKIFKVTSTATWTAIGLIWSGIILTWAEKIKAWAGF